jgi:hypothetical protein
MGPGKGLLYTVLGSASQWYYIRKHRDSSNREIEWKDRHVGGKRMV